MPTASEPMMNAPRGIPPTSIYEDPTSATPEAAAKPTSTLTAMYQKYQQQSIDVSLLHPDLQTSEFGDCTATQQLGVKVIPFNQAQGAEEPPTLSSLYAAVKSSTLGAPILAVTDTARKPDGVPCKQLPNIPAVPDGRPDYMSLLLGVVSSSAKATTSSVAAPITNIKSGTSSGLLAQPSKADVLQPSNNITQHLQSSIGALDLQLKGYHLSPDDRLAAASRPSMLWAPLVLPQQPQQSPANNRASAVPPPAGMAGCMQQQLLLNQLALAGGQPGFSHAAAPVSLEAVHAAAAAAATVAIANHRAAFGASHPAAFESSMPSSPNRHSYRSDGSINTLYKTQICRAWLNTGYCKYEERCQFAHGHGDLHGVYRPAKYKTVPCRNLKVMGYCPFGKRCNFIHPDEVQDDRSPTASGLSSTSWAIASEDTSSRRGSSSGGAIPAVSMPAGGFPGLGVMPTMVGGLHCQQMMLPADMLGLAASSMNMAGMNNLRGLVSASANPVNLLGVNAASILNGPISGMTGGLDGMLNNPSVGAGVSLGSWPNASFSDMMRMLLR